MQSRQQLNVRTPEYYALTRYTRLLELTEEHKNAQKNFGTLAPETLQKYDEYQDYHYSLREELDGNQPLKTAYEGLEEISFDLFVPEFKLTPRSLSFEERQRRVETMRAEIFRESLDNIHNSPSQQTEMPLSKNIPANIRPSTLRVVSKGN
jgi:hypothetical protein